MSKDKTGTEDWAEIARRLRSRAFNFEDSDQAADLCERMARGELVERDKCEHRRCAECVDWSNR